jgi:glyoxylase-like metal-dependent hydrolase (beta-lactamase superfamily II)
MPRQSAVHRVVPLTFGWVTVPKSVSVCGADPAVRLREPVPGVLLELDGGWLLLDVGFNDATVSEPRLQHLFATSNYEIEPLEPGRSFEAAFELAGVNPDDVIAVAASHFHFDHVGGLRHFAGRVPVYVQRAELRFGLDQARAVTEAEGIYRVDFDDPNLDWRVVDGDTEIVPGVTALHTAGHTPGHQSFVVDLADPDSEPGYVFAFDAADLQENIDDELPIGSAVGVDPASTVESIRRLKAIAAERGYRIVPGHDPDAWPRFTREMGNAEPRIAAAAAAAEISRPEVSNIRTTPARPPKSS